MLDGSGKFMTLGAGSALARLRNIFLTDKKMIDITRQCRETLVCHQAVASFACHVLSPSGTVATLGTQGHGDPRIRQDGVDSGVPIPESAIRGHRPRNCHGLHP